MKAAPHLLIITHRHDAFEGKACYLEEISRFWREQGMKVTVQRGPGPKIDADVAILHVDATYVPQEYIDYAKTYPVTINAGISDISKRRISRQLVHPGDGYEGPVIVKTNGNYGGQSDAGLRNNRGGLGGTLTRLRQRLPWYCRSQVVKYPIYSSPREVPKLVWLNPDLLVERLLVERRDDLYLLRIWIFLGDREYHSIVLARHPLVKWENVLGRERGTEAPAELHRLRKELNFEFGKFDYAIVDGKAVLFDTNTTPTWCTGGELLTARARILQEGIHSFLSPREGPMVSA